MTVWVLLKTQFNLENDRCYLLTKVFFLTKPNHTLSSVSLSSGPIFTPAIHLNTTLHYQSSGYVTFYRQKNNLKKQLKKYNNNNA